MSKKISFSSRLNIGFALLVVFLLVLATNRIDKRHFETVQDTLITVYKDRVVAQDYLFKMNNIMHKKQLQLYNSSVGGSQDVLNKEFAILIDEFSKTKLIPSESKAFEVLKVNFNTLKFNENGKRSQFESKELLNSIEAVKHDLKALSHIQVSESKQRIDMAQKSLDTNSFMSTIEIVFLILIGIIIQVIVFYKVKTSAAVDI